MIQMAIGECLPYKQPIGERKGKVYSLAYAPGASQHSFK